MARMLFVGPIWEGSTVKHRLSAFRALGIEVAELDSGERTGKPASLLDRARHKLRWPADHTGLNDRLITAARVHRPEILFVDSVKTLRADTLATVREETGCRIAYYSPDDMSAAHNSSRQLESSDNVWDCYFTTKSFNVPELAARGVRRPILIGNAFDAVHHRPLTAEEVGPDFERFDAVFAGAPERARINSVNRLAAAGFSVIAYGWERGRPVDPRVTVRPAQYAHNYTRAIHTGKVALCFLRKLNRDKVTTRSVELPAAARPMLAEKTAEHDALFTDGTEYLSFHDDVELVRRLGELLADGPRRRSLAEAGRARCLAAGYSTVDRAREMLAALGIRPGGQPE